MSAESAAALEGDDGRGDLPDHLTRDGANIEHGSLQLLERDNEAYCLGCGRRVTVGSSGREYGHRRHPKAERCEHRPSECDPFDNVNAKTPSERSMHDGEDVRDLPEGVGPVR